MSAMDAVMEETTVHGITSEPTQLGPAIYLEVFVNGVKVSALIDTSSPVTLLSLKEVMRILEEGL